MTPQGFKRVQLGLFVPDTYRPPAQTWAPPPPAIKTRLQELRAEFATMAANSARARARGGMRY